MRCQPRFGEMIREAYANLSLGLESLLARPRTNLDVSRFVV